MPELPEVETIRRGLEKRIVGLTIQKVSYDTPKMLRPNPEKLAKGVKEAKIVKVGRRAKMPLVFLDNQGILAFHLKLNGQLLVRRASDPPDKYVHLTFFLDRGWELRFAELRKFGWVKLVKNKEELKVLDGDLGPEPLGDDFSLKYFQKVLGKTARAIKIVLMDQKIIAGVGNIYAAEALFYAGIDPQRPAKGLTEEEVKRLHQKVIWVLKQGIKYEGATDRDAAYRQVTGEPGHYQEHFAVYAKAGEKCHKCGGKVKRINLGGRGTYFCPKCQK